jgi:nucleoside phosphorylase
MSNRDQQQESDQGPSPSASKRRKLQCVNEDEDHQEQKLSHDDYTIGWICALPLEMATAKAMLDEIHTALPITQNDHNSYTLGRISEHNIVIACLPSGVYGITSAATVATQMLSTFGSIRFGFMVGIGGGVPSKQIDIRLGDVVVSSPNTKFGGVVQYDYGKTIRGGQFECTGTLNKSHPALLTAVAKLRADHELSASRIPSFLSYMVRKYPLMQAKYTYRGQQQDQLFEAWFDHVEPYDTCDHCDRRNLVTRSARTKNYPAIHYGLITSVNQVMKDGRTRDRLAKDLGIICFEMEAAGLMDNFPCLVIRGICDYADSHKNKQWQEYAAATAAAYAKELLCVIPANQVQKAPKVSGVTLNTGEPLFFRVQCLVFC